MFTPTHYVPTGYVKKTTCEGCQRKITLDTIDADGVLIGAECLCGEYVTRYLPGMEII